MNLAGNFRNRKPPKVNRKPAWDGTVSDLSVHKLTAEEILQRKLDHISKNKTSNSSFETNENFDTIYDRLTKTRYGNTLKDKNIKERKEFLQGALVSDKELYNLFKQSEDTLATVESMFGEQAKRHVVKPFVTAAPRMDMLLNSNNSNSVALNDMECTEPVSRPRSAPRSRRTLDSPDLDDEEIRKFRQFIDQERGHESRIQEQLDGRNKVVVERKDAATGTETVTCHQSDVAVILDYVCDQLQPTRQQSSSHFLSSRETISCDRFIQLLQNRDRQHEKQVSSLQNHCKENKELIDALTLELIKTTEKQKNLRSEYDQFTKATMNHMSEIQSVLLKRLVSGSEMQLESPRNVLQHRQQQHHKQTESISSQLQALQMDRDNTLSRLKNLQRIHDSVLQANGSEI